MWNVSLNYDSLKCRTSETAICQRDGGNSMDFKTNWLVLEWTLSVISVKMLTANVDYSVITGKTGFCTQIAGRNLYHLICPCIR